MPCCKCNKSVSCKGCACAKEEAPCVSCRPGKLGKCVNPMNQAQPSSPQSQASIPLTKDQVISTASDGPPPDKTNQPAAGESEYQSLVQRAVNIHGLCLSL